MKKSVERTRRKVKKDDGEVINEIIININQPEEKKPDETKEKEAVETKEQKKKKAVKRRRLRKLKAIKKLKEKLNKFRVLKEEAKAKNIPLPAILGQSPEDIEKINSVKEIENLSNEIDNRNLEIESIINNAMRGQQQQGIQTPMSQNLLGGVFAPQIPQTRITPSPQQIAQQPSQPAQIIAQLNTLYNQISSQYRDFISKLGTDNKNTENIREALDTKTRQEILVLSELTQKLDEDIDQWISLLTQFI